MVTGALIPNNSQIMLNQRIFYFNEILVFACHKMTILRNCHDLQVVEQIIENLGFSHRIVLGLKPQIEGFLNHDLKVVAI